MKAVSALLLPALLFSVLAAPAHALTAAEPQELADADRAEIHAILDAVLDGIYMGGASGSELIKPHISPNAPETLSSDIFWGLPTAEATKNIHIQVEHEYVMGDEVRMTALIEYSSDTFENATDAFFIFKREEGKWWLYDTDFYRYLGTPHESRLSPESSHASPGEFEVVPPAEFGSALGFLGFLAGFGILFILIPVALFLAVFAFWLWMLIEACMRKEYENKALWIVLIIIFGAVAAVFYYFMQHRLYKKQAKAEAAAPAAIPPASPPAA